MDKKLSLIGCGNLGGALIRGIAREVYQDRSRICVCDHDKNKVDSLVAEFGLRAENDVAMAVKDADIIIVAVKPNQMASVLAEIGQAKINPETILISVAAGITTDFLKKHLGLELVLVRAMPNIACLISRGSIGIFSPTPQASELAKTLFQNIGEVIVFQNESDIDIVTAVGASSPGYLFLVIDALAQGASQLGLAQEQATRFAALAVFGAGALALETERSPEELRKSVSSPGGTTLAGLAELERAGVKETFIKAIKASTERAQEMSRELSLQDS